MPISIAEMPLSLAEVNLCSEQLLPSSQAVSWFTSF